MLSLPVNNSEKVLNYRRPGAARRGGAFAATIALTVAGLAGCGGGSGSSDPAIRIGMFPNITHAPALVGLEKGFFAKAVGGSNKLAAPKVFGAGPLENEAILGGDVDTAFEGPSSALSIYQAHHGLVTIVAGVASGGAGLVVNKSITRPSQLRGKSLGSPQLANTQDVALRYWLKTHGLPVPASGNGPVKVLPSSTGSGTIVTEFKSGNIAGAWVPEPYEHELIKAGGHVLVNEAKLWPHGQWATTLLVVRTAFLKEHRAEVKDFLEGLVTTIHYMDTHKAAAEKATSQELLKLGHSVSPSVLSAAWTNLKFTTNPYASTFATQVRHGEAVGLLHNPGHLGRIFDLTILNSILKSKGQPEVAGP